MHERTAPKKVLDHLIQERNVPGIEITSIIQFASGPPEMSVHPSPQTSSPGTVMDRLPDYGWILVALVTVLLGWGGGGVTAEAQDVHVGVRTGPAFGFLNDSPVPFVSVAGNTSARTNVRLDLHGSVYALFSFPNRWVLRPELAFVQKGGHFSRVGYEFYAAEQYRVSYLQGQLLGQYPVSLPGPLSLHAVGGLTVDRAISGALQRNIWSRGNTFEDRIGLVQNDLIRRWDIGAVIGVGLEYALEPSSRVALTFRYNPGFRSVFTQTQRPHFEQVVNEWTDPPTLSESPPKLRHDLITVGLSYTFPFSR